MTMQSDTDLFLEAGDHFKRGDLLEAEILLKEFLKSNPFHAQALKNLTAVLIKKGSPPAPPIKTRIKRLYSLYDKALEDFREHRFDQAVEGFEQIVTMAETDGLTSHFAEASRDLVAEVRLEQEVYENSLLIQKLFNEGQQLFELTRYEECIEKMMAVLSIDPSHEEAVAIIKRATRLRDSS